MSQIVVYQASLGLSWSLQGEERILIESAFARLRKISDGAAAGKTTVSTVVDEPFVFQAICNFIQEEDEEFYRQFMNQYGDPTGENFELHAPLDLIYAFHKKQLKQEMFSFLKSVGTPIAAFGAVSFPTHLFAHGHLATIVGWKEYKWRGTEYKGMLTMNDFMEAHYKNGSRKDNQLVPPFYYPEPSHSGLDIVFVLQINDQLYPVFVRTTKFFGDNNVMSPENAEDARLTVHETHIKTRYLPNLAMYCPGGKYLSLLYYIHSTIDKKSIETETGAADRRDNHVWDYTDDGDDNMRLTQLLMIIDESNIRDFVPGGV
ncbi:hypothetical protein BGZ95_002850, partial [Linnemannia exigua]